jgi:hypothetical protein
MPSSPNRNTPLQDFLEEAESELSRRLREACEAEARGTPSDSAQEIRELEDSLLAAAMAAEKVLAVRRHLDKPDQQREPRVPSADSADRHSDDTSVREFEDEAGRRWRAWPVTPNLARATEASRRSLGDFQDGWICFEALDNSGRRRLPQRGRRWSDLPLEHLPHLLAEAITVPERKARRESSKDTDAIPLN